LYYVPLTDPVRLPPPAPPPLAGLSRRERFTMEAVVSGRWICSPLLPFVLRVFPGGEISFSSRRLRFLVPYPEFGCFFCLSYPCSFTYTGIPLFPFPSTGRGVIYLRPKTPSKPYWGLLAGLLLCLRIASLSCCLYVNGAAQLCLVVGVLLE